MNRIILVAVGGSGMSALARLFWSLGYRNIIGIDQNESELTRSLQDLGMTIYIGHGQVDIGPTDYVIYSAAAEQSVEVQTSLGYIGTNPKKVFPPVNYFQFLGELSKYFFTIAISGTHGKSTTTALTAQAMKHIDPDFGLAILGAGVADRGGANMCYDEKKKDDIYSVLQRITNPKQGGVEQVMKKYSFVVEACEYKKHFLTLDVDMAVVTNIELDHADVYKDIDEYVETFEVFAKKVLRAILVLDDNIYISKLEAIASCPVISITPQTYAFKYMLGSHNYLNASLAQAVIEQYVEYRKSSSFGRRNDGRIQASEGMENGGMKNWITTSVNEEQPPRNDGSVSSGMKNDDILSKKITTYIQNFTALRRRGELLGKNKHGVAVITDYAHHPSELGSTIDAIQEKYGDELTVIFQPHQARRVVEFWGDFVKTLQGVVDPVIYDIYTAREQVSDIADYEYHADLESGVFDDIQTFDQLGEIFAESCGGIYMKEFDALYAYIQGVEQGVVLVCSAGNVDWELRKRIGV